MGDQDLAEVCYTLLGQLAKHLYYAHRQVKTYKRLITEVTRATMFGLKQRENPPRHQAASIL